MRWKASEREARKRSVPQIPIAYSLLITVASYFAQAPPALGQWAGNQTGCYADSLVANPNRPTVSNPAHVTQYGALELEYGWDHFWPQGGVTETSLGGLLKFGLLCDLELRWNSASFISQTDSTGTHSTIGDNWLGTEFRFHRQTVRLPTMAFSYASKIPSARTEHGLGTGRVDHAFTFGASETLAGFNLDFNLTEYLIGRPGTPSFDENQQLALALSRAIHGGVQFSGEIYGVTELNKTTPGFASSLWAITYTVVPRLVIDAGFEAGLTSNGPHRHAFCGLTFSIADLYPGWHRRRAKTNDKPQSMG